MELASVVMSLQGDTISKQIASEAAKQMGAFGESAGRGATKFIVNMVGKPEVLMIGLVLIIVTAVLLFFLKKIIINSILGLIAWSILKYYFHTELPFIASLVVSMIFGLAGVGTLLILKFFGIL